MTTHNANDVANYLRTLPNCSGVLPVAVTIKGTRYEGAAYIDEAHNKEETRFYLLGELPACYRRSRHTTFRFDGDSRDWYIAGYMPRENLKPENARYNPCGINFLLMAWNHSSAIDAHEPTPYARVAARLDYESDDDAATRAADSLSRNALIDAAREGQALGEDDES
jgi:hypothetical protein